MGGRAGRTGKRVRWAYGLDGRAVGLDGRAGGVSFFSTVMFEPEAGGNIASRQRLGTNMARHPPEAGDKSGI